MQKKQTEPIRIFWSKLIRMTGSTFKVQCPFCKDGLLVMRRDEQCRLLRSDNCVSCGTMVRYMDKEILGEKLY